MYESRTGAENFQLRAILGHFPVDIFQNIAVLIAWL